MLATLINEKRLCDLQLPDKISGKYWMTDICDGRHRRLLAIEASLDEKFWVVKTTKQVTFVGSAVADSDHIRLTPGVQFELRIYEENYFLSLDEDTNDRVAFQKLQIQSDASVSIGRGLDNAIILDNSYVSSHHALLQYRGGQWSISDQNSQNGTYVNHIRMTGEMFLFPGDVIYIQGLRAIVGKDYLSVNNPNGMVQLNTDVFSQYTYEESNRNRESSKSETRSYYYRSPHFEKTIPVLEFKVDAPSSPVTNEKTPMLLALGPSLVMGVASFVTGIFSVTNGLQDGKSFVDVLPTMIMSLAMLTGMIIFPFILKKREKKQRLEDAKERKQKYLAYLSHLSNETEVYKRRQKEMLESRSPVISKLASEDTFWERKLWNRTPLQEDFLRLRIGSGNRKMFENISFPEQRFTVDDDDLMESLNAFRDEERLLTDVPMELCLRDYRALGIIGSHDGIYNMLHNLLLQVALLHSYDEVKIICLCDEDDLERISYIKTMRHIWDNEGKRRYLACTNQETRELSIYARKYLFSMDRETKEDGDIYYIILSLSQELLNSCAFVQDILEDESFTNYTLICAYDKLKALPKECHTVIEVQGKQGMLQKEDGALISFLQDSVDEEDAEKYIRQTAAYELDLNRGSFELPGAILFMQMFGVGKCEHLNILNRWKENNPVQSLRTPIGVDTNGATFYLDLHEKYHGPHGLVAGMTGSGKSEFLITYILSMAVNYHPDEVAFVLIDYKGGGLAGAFENDSVRLPHLAGTITNLDGNAVMRAMQSITSELRRRQTIFNQARLIANEATMDIYKYQKMYREGMLSEPIPHLFIIADEFAELKSQQPEFLEQLISTARIGRSLGVHLILATQKPAGVVNEQIWANSKFKVCLKVQDRADSNDMLKRPDAAELVETGRFYLQVGYNELFELGQSAYSGGLYEDTDEATSANEDEIEIINHQGEVVDSIKERGAVSAEKGTQIVNILSYMGNLAKSENLQQRQLWLPEIPPVIMADDVIKKYSQTWDTNPSALIGEYDDPYHQSRHPLVIDFENMGNVLLYGAVGSGKEMFISALLYSLFEKYSVEQLHNYILDFDSEGLKVFQNAPHNGGVLLDGDLEGLQSFFTMLRDELKRRKKKLSDSAETFAGYQKNHPGEMPYYIVIIHNYIHFYENYEAYDDVVVSLTRECPKYGIYFLISANNASGIRYRLEQNFGKRYVLSLNDKSDYSVLLGNTGGIFPDGQRGRGLIREDEIYMFQTMSLTPEEDNRIEFLRKMCERWPERESHQKAKKIPMIPKFISGMEYADKKYGAENMVLGVSFRTYQEQIVDMTKRNILFVISQSEDTLRFFEGGILECLSHNDSIRKVVVNGKGMLRELTGDIYETLGDDLETSIVSLFETVVERNNNYKDTQGHPTVDMTPMLIILSDYGKLSDALSEDGKDKLRVMLDKTREFCQMYFIVTDNYQATGRYSTEGWIGNRTEGTGLWLGEGVDSQMRFSVNRSRGYVTSGDESCLGYYIKGGKAAKIRPIMAEQAEEIINEQQNIG